MSESVEGGTYEAEGTDFGCERGGCADLTAGRAQVDDLDLVGVLETLR